MKRTAPVRVSMRPLTIAVNVIVEPSGDGFPEADNVVVDVRFFQRDEPTACTETPEITDGGADVWAYDLASRNLARPNPRV